MYRRDECYFTNEWNVGALQTFALHPLDGSLFLLDGKDQALVHIDNDGKLLANAALAIPQKPRLRLHSGLLFMNSGAGPAISVFLRQRIIR